MRQTMELERIIDWERLFRNARKDKVNLYIHAPTDSSRFLDELNLDTVIKSIGKGKVSLIGGKWHDPQAILYYKDITGFEYEAREHGGFLRINASQLGGNYKTAPGPDI